MSELIWQSATELARRIAAREVSSAEVVDAHIARIESVNSNLNAVVVPLYEQARAAAKLADARLANGESVGPLHGVPVTVKECYHVAGTVSSIGVSCLTGEIFEHDGPLVHRLRKAGAVILGKTNVPQAMLMYETDNPVYGRTNNPWDLARSPGGSSGGEAAIIAAGGSPLGLANDLGGSIRQPAHACGLFGLKPTAGRFTNHGSRNNLSGLKLIASLTGAIARYSVDLQLAMRVLHPTTAGEPRCDDEADRPLPDPAGVDVSKLRIGYFDDDDFFRPAPAVRRAVHESVAVLQNAGAELIEFKPPDVATAIALYFALLGSDGARSLHQTLQGDPIDWRIARLIKVGRIEHPWRKVMAAVASIAGQPRVAMLLKSTGRKTPEQMRRLADEIGRYSARFHEEMDRAGIDALLFPPHALPAPLHGSTIDLPATASYCFLPNLLGLPAGVAPCTRVRADEETDRRPGIDMVERIAAWQAREDDIGFLRDLRRRPRRHAADLLELLQGASPIAKDAMATGDEMLADFRADLADADEADGLHAVSPGRNSSVFC